MQALSDIIEEAQQIVVHVLHVVQLRHIVGDVESKIEPTFALQCVLKYFEPLICNRTSRAVSSQLKMRVTREVPILTRD